MAVLVTERLVKTIQVTLAMVIKMATEWESVALEHQGLNIDNEEIFSLQIHIFFLTF